MIWDYILGIALLKASSNLSEDGEKKISINLAILWFSFRNYRFALRMKYLVISIIHLFFFIQAFWNDFPSGRMDKPGFVRYYEEIKDENDKTNILCE